MAVLGHVPRRGGDDAHKGHYHSGVSAGHGHSEACRGAGSSKAHTRTHSQRDHRGCDKAQGALLWQCCRVDVAAAWDRAAKKLVGIQPWQAA